MNAGWLRVTHRRRGLFLGIMLVLAATLGWLGWRLLAQDEQLARQRSAEQREVAADLLVAGLGQRLLALEQALDRALTQPDAIADIPMSDDAVVVRVTSGILHAWPERRLLYYPLPSGPDPVSDPLFDKA